MKFFVIDVRAVLDQLIRDRGEDYASLSRLLGRNAAYVQQFIHRGVPRKLAEDDRRVLARYFGIDEAELGAPLPVAGTGGKARSSPSVVMVPRLRIGASAGPGALVGDETPAARIGFEGAWLRTLSNNPAALSIIQVSGDSMMPTLADGDDILVDRGDGADRVRDGVYVLRLDDVLMVKRLAINPVARTLTIRSDNPAYPDWTDCDPATVDVIGRVIWVGRKMV
jgi:Peptidase S24-like